MLGVSQGTSAREKETGCEIELVQSWSALVLVVAVEKGLGIDVPGVDVGSDWLTHVFAALGLGTLRAGINGANK